MDIEKYKKIPFRKRTHCVVCNAKASEAVFELPDFPLTEIYVDKNISQKVGFVDQAFHLCNCCGHGQNVNVIDQDFLYSDNYFHRTSASLSSVVAIDSFLEFINSVAGDSKFENIIEIGCNDLYTLKKLRNKADKLFGIDPILREKEGQIEDEKIKVVGDFVENVNLRELNINRSIVLSSYTLEHIEDPKELMRSLLDNATSETLFFFQFPGLESLIQNSRFDQVFHQHFNYFSLQTVLHMLNDIEAELIDFRVNPYHWGALLIAFKRKGKNSMNPNDKFKEFTLCFTREQILKQYSLFKDGLELTNRRLLSFKGEKIYGYGAALMLPILDYYLDGLSELECIVDDDKNKDGLYYINLPLQILHLEKINNIKDAIVLITAINSKHATRAIMSKLIDLRVRQIIVPANLI